MFVADLHNDVLQRVMIGEDISSITNNGHSDLIRLNKSCIDLEVFVVWITDAYLNKNPFHRANELIDELEKLEKNNALMKIPNSYNDIISSKKADILSTPFSLEGGEIIEDKIENLYHFIERGLMYFGLTWNRSLNWASSAFDENHNKKNIKSFGLNSFGKEVVNVCNDNNIIIDVSHIGEKSFWDVDKYSSKPYIASHSNAYNLCKHFRNLKDDQLLAIKKKNGLIGLVPCPYFLDHNFFDKKNKFLKNYENEINNFNLTEKNITKLWLKKQHFFQKALKSITPSIELFVDHIEYVIKLTGIDYVGIGSDYDGLDCLPTEMNDCEDHILIIDSLKKRGYTHIEVEKIMGLNFLRVYQEVKQ